MATSQHRCVFVGNIPYDATEEQLIQICEEVGPVVSFRLVIDRETGKPKGYGFCEYKDEETALSARRNLQGYEINGRQLRVDFAENDKGADRNREQGRGGPGMVANVDPQKQIERTAVLGDSFLYQPVGLSLAMTAATVMAGALGGAQAGGNSIQNVLQGQPAMGADPLTLHLAKMSRNQLNEIMSDLKVMATQNREQARQLLVTSPQLTKALFQAEIILGMVSPQMLQMPNIRAAPGPLPQPSLPGGQQGLQPAVQTLHGLPPLAQSKVPFGLMPKVQEGQASAVPPNSFVHNQYSSLPQPARNQVLQTLNSGVSTFPSMHTQTLNSVSVRPQSQLASSSSMQHQMQPSLLQHPGQVGAANLGQNNQLVAPNGALRPSLLTRPPFSDQAFQVPNFTCAFRVQYSTLPSVTSEKANMVHATIDPMGRPSKMLKLNDGRSNTFSAADLNASISVSGPSQVSGTSLLSGNQIPKTAEAQNSVKQVPQVQLPPEMESALLQQVLNLTPEQLSSLSPTTHKHAGILCSYL